MGRLLVHGSKEDHEKVEALVNRIGKARPKPVPEEPPTGEAAIARVVDKLKNLKLTRLEIEGKTLAEALRWLEGECRQQGENLTLRIGEGEIRGDILGRRLRIKQRNLSQILLGDALLEIERECEIIFRVEEGGVVAEGRLQIVDPSSASKPRYVEEVMPSRLDWWGIDYPNQGKASAPLPFR